MHIEPITGAEPVSAAWKAAVLAVGPHGHRVKNEIRTHTQFPVPDSQSGAFTSFAINTI